MKKVIAVFTLTISLLAAFSSCAKKPITALEESSKEISEAIIYTEEEKVQMYDDFVEEKNQELNEMVDRATELAENPTLSPKYIADVKKELDNVIEKADEILNYDTATVPEKYKEIHQKYIDSVSKIKELSEQAPRVAMSLDESKILDMAHEFQDAYSVFVQASEEYQNAK